MSCFETRHACCVVVARGKNIGKRDPSELFDHRQVHSQQWKDVNQGFVASSARSTHSLRFSWWLRPQRFIRFVLVCKSPLGIIDKCNCDQVLDRTIPKNRP